MRVWKLRPTIRGILTLGTFVFVVVTAIVTGTPELAPLAVVIGVPLAVSPLLAYRRAGRANASLVLHAHVEPGAVEAGTTVSYTHLRAHETDSSLVCRLLLD